jgi:glycosyltransferase involved in cell wall biosynthesis
MMYDYFPYFTDAGIECDVSPLLDDTYYRLLRENNRGRRALRLLRQGAERVLHTVQASSYDVIVLEKELIPFLPYALETVLFRQNKKVISMYDEATHSYYQQHRNPLVRWLTSQKIERIIVNSAHVVVWNPVMRDFARARNRNVSEVTTGIDMRRYQQKKDYAINGRPLRIGWIGSSSGFRYLHMLDAAIQRLANQHDIELYVVSSDQYELQGVRVNNRSWSVASEVADLTAMDIGIMPLPDDEWAAGKSGCKMLQYMGVGLPVVVSPVGVNATIVSHGENGLLAFSPEDWVENLSLLIEQPQLRERLGAAGRRYIERHNSQEKIAAVLTDILSTVAREP